MLLATTIWIWCELNATTEGTEPDRLDLGTVQAGSRVEISARFLTLHEPPLQAFYMWLCRRLPVSWRPLLSHFNPRKLHAPAPKLPDLSVLKPEIRTPPF